MRHRSQRGIRVGLGGALREGIVVLGEAVDECLGDG